ncbi:MAG: metallophosphoesterase family protein [Clostridia bacterium]|nr:metallophosphoesterase family protein [Clostridia bacterium]
MTRKILIFSDSHGETKYLSRAMSMNPDADMIVHLGDGASDLTRPLPENYEKPLVLIEGNGEYYGWLGVDRRYRPKRTETIEFEGKRIFMTHGHLYDVKYGLERIAARAYADGADIVLFGHTHVPISEYIPEGTELEFVGKTERPLILFNPGSIGMGIKHSFGILSFSNGGVLPSHGVI